jgi:hypothetical protein
MISDSEDIAESGGAFVRAWIWVDNSELPEEVQKEYFPQGDDVDPSDRNWEPPYDHHKDIELLKLKGMLK